jgi:adenylylsulfate kinase
MLQPTLFWFTGLSGAGKTTIGKTFYQELILRSSNLVFLDGDIIREVLGNRSGHTMEDRFELAMTYSRLCKMLVDQGISVVCCTVSMFHKVREWNRANIKNYKEIYIKVPMEILYKRDQKGLYSGAKEGKIKNVIGVDLPFEEPTNPDYIIFNDDSVEPEKLLNDIFSNQFY